MKYACKKAGTSAADATERWKRPHNADKNHMAAARRALPREIEYGAENICTGATRESPTCSTRLRTK